jgi:hypothetical protein
VPFRDSAYAIADWIGPTDSAVVSMMTIPVSTPVGLHRASASCAAWSTADSIRSSGTISVWGKDDDAAEDSASCGAVAETGTPENVMVSSSEGVLSDCNDRKVLTANQGRS